MEASPNKRRALAPLNSNALPSPRPLSTLKPGKPVADTYVGSPLRKRAVEAATAAAMEPSPKRACAEQDQKSPSRGSTPEEDDSSLFDNDASWTSVTTPGGSPAQRTMTREQAREKAEILRLRLGLASYKVRTGQTEVPLSQLVAKPLHRRDATTTQDHSDQEQKQEQEQDEDDEEEKQELPQLRRVDEAETMATPKRQVALRDEERLTSSALRGGAASGLLSLARGALGE